MHNSPKPRSYVGWRRSGFYYPIEVMTAFGIEDIELLGGKACDPKHRPPNFQLIELVPGDKSISRSWEIYEFIKAHKSVQKTD